MPSPCSLCKAECCKTYTITITIFDLVRIIKTQKKQDTSQKTKTKKLDLDSFVFLSEPRLLSYDPDCVFDTEDGYFLLCLKSHPCYFLDLKTNLCKIHDSAPLSCRRYPYTIQGKPNARFCPFLPKLLFGLKGADIDSKELVRELEEHKKIVAEWNKKSTKKTKKKLMEFLMEKINLF
jgi:Fe-S-cluster containining protein